MITLTFEETVVDGCAYTGVATIRGSGTEPKLKYYVEAATSLDGGKSADAMQKAKIVAKAMANAVIEFILRPIEFGLTPPSD
jgi:phosphomannomutase